MTNVVIPSTREQNKADFQRMYDTMQDKDGVERQKAIILQNRLMRKENIIRDVGM